jgi:hypothetical protein
MKASLMNHYLERCRDFDAVFVIDDDHELIGTDNLVEVKGSLLYGYNFVVGKICEKGGGFLRIIKDMCRGQRTRYGTTSLSKWDFTGST